MKKDDTKHRFNAKVPMINRKVIMVVERRRDDFREINERIKEFDKLRFIIFEERFNIVINVAKRNLFKVGFHRIPSDLMIRIAVY
ncbi:hypothetical protein [Caldanaerobius fijiensis]|uniref:hypothetical protein n=1 Tax=Caldanaerobius fijiensis TaxID=456330 RepID=UPI0013566E24|nr:hypothetical protein [Caldanaerobius fijiensis]